MTEQNVVKQEEQLVGDLLETRFLTPKGAVFSQTEGGFLSLTVDGTDYGRVKVIRAFPFTDPQRYLSVRQADNEEREIGMIEDLAFFDPDTVGWITSQLAMRYFVPKILKVREIKEEYGYSYWWVETDKGTCRFTCDQNGVTKLSDTRLLISDIDGNRFELADTSVLSAKELRMVDLYM